MTTLYLLEPQTFVRRDGDTLVVHIPANETTGQPKRKQRVPLLKVDRVVVQGDSTLTTPAIGALMQKRADVIFLNRYGKFQGYLNPAFSKNGQLRIAQTQAHIDWSFRNRLGQAFVDGKLNNLRTLLLRYNRTRKQAVLAEAADKISALRSKLQSLDLNAIPPDPQRPQANSIYGSLHGIEGNGSSLYFKAFKYVLKSPDLFQGRTRRPPRDPVNALLSYGYTILLNQVLTALCVVGLDPYIGYLHGTKFGKPALALDLMEEFRPIITDSVVITLLNTEVITPQDFTEQLGAFRLSDKARRTFLTRLETRLNDKIQHPTFGYKATYRRCIELQARLLAKTVTGEIPTYVPFRVR